MKSMAMNSAVFTGSQLAMKVSRRILRMSRLRTARSVIAATHCLTIDCGIVSNLAAVRHSFSVYFHEQRLVFLVVIVGLEQNRLFVHRSRGVLGGFIHGPFLYSNSSDS